MPDPMPDDMFEDAAHPRPTRFLPWIGALAILLVVGIQQASVRKAAEAPFTPDPARQVLLLETSWCGICVQTRGYLDRNGVAYERLDVETSAEGARRHAAVGGSGVPVVIVDDAHIVHGFDPVRLARLLRVAEPGAR